jgi:hypothetical protein
LYRLVSVHETVELEGSIRTMCVDPTQLDRAIVEFRQTLANRQVVDWNGW